MKINTESKTVIEMEAHFDGRALKTHDCELGEWWGEEVCEEYNFNDVIKESRIPEGEYKIVITLEKIK
jgi:hypothetical protein